MSARSDIPLCDCSEKDKLYRVTNFPDSTTDEDMEAHPKDGGYRTAWTCLQAEHYWDAIDWVLASAQLQEYFVYSPKHKWVGYGFRTGEN